MKVAVVSPGDVAFQIREIDGAYETLHEIIGGYIESLRLDGGHIALFDEEGLLKHQEFACNVITANGVLQPICGTCIIVGFTGMHFSDVDERKLPSIARVGR